MLAFKTHLLTPALWKLYQQVRLNTLQESPDAFGVTYAQEAALSDAQWQARLDLKARAINALPLVTEIAGKPVAIAWAMINDPQPQTTDIYQMWVCPTERGKGLAKSLLEQTKTWAMENGCTQLALAVTTNNQAAVNLYTSFGFVLSGATQPLRAHSKLLVQPMLMPLTNDAVTY